jgi:hypothetical protein
MPFKVTVSRSPDYVRYDAAGPTSLKSFTELATFVAADTARYEDVKVLVDLRRVEGRLTRHEQALLGEVAAFKLPYVFKLASLVPATEVTRTSERAAVEKGLTLRVFDRESEALAWLLEADVG